MPMSSDENSVLAIACCLLVAVACAPTKDEAVLASFPLDTTEGFTEHVSSAEVVEVEGGPALKLEGMVLAPEIEAGDVGIEVEILAEQPCYPGIVFRFADPTNYELAYAVPHASGQPDAIQYDPVFNGANTWQLHSGVAYQQFAEIPTGEWFTLRLDVVGDRAVVRVGDQPPLVVERLSHGVRRGRVGLWTFRPALFRNLTVGAPRSLDGLTGTPPMAPPDAITGWHLEGVGTVACEPNGVLNLNRFLASSPDAVRLTRRFETDSAGEVELHVGFSDALTLRLDGELIFEGQHTFTGFESLSGRGWAEPGTEPVHVHVEAGVHELEATLAVTEPFGWGQTVTLSGADLRLLPVAEHE